jgi:hypothetical protein
VVLVVLAFVSGLSFLYYGFKVLLRTESRDESSGTACLVLADSSASWRYSVGRRWSSASPLQPWERSVGERSLLSRAAAIVAREKTDSAGRYRLTVRCP